MAHLGMSDDEMTTVIKDGFDVDSSFSAKDLFEGSRRQSCLPMWNGPCIRVHSVDLGLSSSAGLQLQHARSPEAPDLPTYLPPAAATPHRAGPTYLPPCPGRIAFPSSPRFRLAGT